MDKIDTTEEGVKNLMEDLNEEGKPLKTIITKINEIIDWINEQ